MFRSVDKVKKLKEEKPNEGENEIIFIFLDTASCEAIKKILTMAYPRELGELIYEEIVRIVKKKITKQKCR